MTLAGRSLRSMARMSVPTLLIAWASPLSRAVTPILPRTWTTSAMQSFLAEEAAFLGDIEIDGGDAPAGVGDDDALERCLAVGGRC